MIAILAFFLMYMVFSFQRYVGEIFIGVLFVKIEAVLIFGFSS